MCWIMSVCSPDVVLYIDLVWRLCGHLVLCIDSGTEGAADVVRQRGQI